MRPTFNKLILNDKNCQLDTCFSNKIQIIIEFCFVVLYLLKKEQENKEKFDRNLQQSN